MLEGYLKMSIFPRTITRDEAVIIHVRIKNYDDIIKFLQLRTYIQDPSGKIVKKFNKDFLLNINSEKNIFKDFYFEFKPDKKNIAGKYLAKTDLYYKGEILHSLTIDDDYFHIEELEIKKVDISNNIKFCIKNKSNEKTKFCIVLVKDGNKKNINKVISGLEEQEFKFSNKLYDEIYVEYGNLYCERILEDKSSKIYLKNKEYNWKSMGNELIVYNHKKQIELNNYLSYIWLSCDGIHTVSEIAKDCQIKENELNKALKKLKNKGLIHLKG